MRISDGSSDVCSSDLQTADYDSQLGFQDQIRALLDERLKAESGVNIDQELASLIQLESAFASPARVLSSVQTALTKLLAIVRYALARTKPMSIRTLTKSRWTDKHRKKGGQGKRMRKKD